MSAEDFRKDWKPLLIKDSRTKDMIRCSLEKFQTYSAEDIQLVASVFPAEIALLIEATAQKLKEAETEQLHESLDPILTDFWEKTLKEQMRQQLNDLIGPQEEIASDGDRGPETPVDREIPTGKRFSVAGKLSDKNTQLIQAAEKGDIQTVQTLLDTGSGVKANVNVEKTNGTKALTVAVQEGHTEIVELLKKAGAEE
jgi:hypothetical protein